jgi:REP element-mobilizing transposase RayT
MSELRKANTDNPYFITLTVVGWIDVFNRREYVEIFIKNINYCQQHKGLKVFAYVIMPSHIHMVVQQEAGKLNEVLRDFKSFTAKEILHSIKENQHESRREWMMYLFKHFGKKSKQNKEYMFWQKTSHPIELYTNSVIDQKINYIHNNPVEAGIVTSPECYVYSSANSFSEINVLEV